MPKKYSIAEARSQLPTIVDQAQAGIEVEITRRGRPVAVIVSRREFDRLHRTHRNFADTYRAFLDQHSLAEIGVDGDFAASSRDRTGGRKVSL